MLGLTGEERWRGGGVSSASWSAISGARIAFRAVYLPFGIRAVIGATVIYVIADFVYRLRYGRAPGRRGFFLVQRLGWLPEATPEPLDAGATAVTGHPR